MIRRPALATVGLVVLGLSACTGGTTTRQVVVDGDPDRGQAVIQTYGCTSCHAIPGVSSVSDGIGPDLDDYGDNRYIAGHVPNRPEELIRWLINPQAIDPGTVMPDTGVTEQDARDIAAYLYDH